MNRDEIDDIRAENIAQTVEKIMKDRAKPEPLEPLESWQINRPAIIAVPNGSDLQDIGPQLRAAFETLRPIRREGTARLDDLGSLIDWANRFKGDTSVLYAKPDMAAPTLTCIADYHGAGASMPTDPEGDPTARHGRHRGVYSFPLSDEWKAWMEVSGKPLDKDELGEFVEANAKDIMDPTPAVLNGAESGDNEAWENRLIATAKQIEGRYGQLTQLLAMSKRFQVYETSNLTVSTNRDTGEAEIQFLNEHKGADGKPLNIPNLIIIAIPVFMGGAPYRLSVRFRYRKMGGQVKFILSVYNPEKAFEAAFREAISTATKDTALPLFMGSPEA